MSPPVMTDAGCALAQALRGRRCSSLQGAPPVVAFDEENGTRDPAREIEAHERGLYILLHEASLKGCHRDHAVSRPRPRD